MEEVGNGSEWVGGRVKLGLMQLKICFLILRQKLSIVHTHTLYSTFKGTFRRRGACVPKLNFPESWNLLSRIHSHLNATVALFGLARMKLEGFSQRPGGNAMPARASPGDRRRASSFWLLKDSFPYPQSPSTSVDWCIFLHIHASFL